jgi:hypothetical protein
MTSSNWSKTAQASSKAGTAADSSSSDADAAAVLRQWLLGSRGKGLLELIEALGGKPVSLKVSHASDLAEVDLDVEMNVTLSTDLQLARGPDARDVVEHVLVGCMVCSSHPVMHAAFRGASM